MRIFFRITAFIFHLIANRMNNATKIMGKLSKELQEEAGRERLMGKQRGGSECEGGL